MKKITLNCPQCGANLEIADDIDTFFCTYCGTKIATGDIARINAQLRVKEMEHEERTKEKDDRTYKQTMLGLVAFILILFGMMFALGIYSDRRDDKLAQQNVGKIKIDTNNTALSGENYKDVENILSDKGFTNVETVEMEKKAGLFKDPGEVDRVVIGGSTDYSNDSYFDPDVSVKIYYYKLDK